ncbi:MAG: hypothetical protein WCE54_04600 [Ignavibacteriaceae bacterium]
MKKVVVLLLLIFAATVFAGAYFYDFNVYHDGDNVVITWKTLQENNISEFVVQRSTPQSSFVDIASIQAKGNNSAYSFTDESAYKTSDLVFIYQIKIVGNDPGDVTYSKPQSVLQNVSGVKQTWGSIKAMFR